MLDKDQFCLETINEVIDKILEYTSGYSSANEFNDAYRDFDATSKRVIHCASDSLKTVSK